MDSEKFFDDNSEFYGCLKPYKHDYFFINFIYKNTKKCSLLDIGGGGGCFTKLCKEKFQEANLCIIDPSRSLLQKQKLEGIKLVIGKLPDELNVEEKFDYIHIKEVLHHVTGSSIGRSRELVSESLINARKLLNKDGHIMVHELFYESYLIPTFSRTMIFYLLKLQNLVKIKVPIKEFIIDLDVCFYTRSELKKICKDLGFEVIDYYEEKWENNRSKKIMLLKDWGRMCFILKPLRENVES